MKKNLHGHKGSCYAFIIHCKKSKLKEAYLKDVDGDVADDVEKVPQGQAANQDVGPIPHTLVLVYDPQQGGIPDDPDHKNQAGHDGVDILEGLHELRGLQTHGGRALWWGGLWAQH